MKRSPFDNPKALAPTIGDWLHNWSVKKQRRNDYAKVEALLDLSRGEYIFRSCYTSCHTLRGGDDVGPDLLGVTGKRQFNSLERCQELPMPNLGLNRIDVVAVIDFMEKESRRQGAATQNEHAHRPHH